ncbi:ArnT family glycosyltransferase [Nonomuraea sp. KM90]|uniref:ArnT family glycosyltransferase n=1 Tax=Nonomuraea sp. KM90 TaxID=3457428 RepID=UPI003FCEBCF5
MTAPGSALTLVTDRQNLSVPAFARHGVLTVAAGLLVILTALSGRYGFHRDELYFIVAGRNLDWSYPDQPPLLPLIMRGITSVFGESIVAVRFPAALMTAAGVVVAALTARELSGSRRAQIMTATAYAVCPFVLSTGHTLYTATADLLLSTTLVWVAMRWARTRDDRLLLYAGALAAVAFQVKYLSVALLAALVVSMLAAGPRDVLRRPLFWAGAAIALLTSAPALLWQNRYGWPQLDMAQAIAGNGSFAGRPGFMPFQIVLTGVVLSVVWIYGAWRLFRAEWLRPFRFLGWTYLLLCAVFLLTGGKPYYLAGLWAGLWAVGFTELSHRHLPTRWAWVTSWPTFVITGVTSVLMTLPVYPVSWVARTPQPYINPDAGETVGWPELVAAVARVRNSLPTNERVVVMAANYGQAGAIDLYGTAHGLPRPYSGHNGYWHFGPPPDGEATTIFVGLDGPQSRAYLRRFWTDVRIAERIDNGVGLNNKEQGTPVWICKGQRELWSVQWPRIAHLS